MEERREPTGGNFNGGFKEFICEEDFYDEEHPHKLNLCLMGFRSLIRVSVGYFDQV